MKTKEQILDWLNKQPWKEEFYEEVFLGRLDKISYNEGFIMDAFCWFGTKSGAGVWAKRHADFINWYDNADKPMSWEEYCKQNPIKVGECYIDDDCSIQYVTTTSLAVDRDANTDANVMSEDLFEAFVAYMKLIQLRNVWVKGVEDNRNCKILVVDDEICVSSLPLCSFGLSFPTDKMANDFKDTFNDLLEIAKPLL